MELSAKEKDKTIREQEQLISELKDKIEKL
jgi:hypothetical protein